MEFSKDQIAAAVAFLHDANRLISSNAVEDVIRQHLATSFYGLFPERPFWIRHHVEGGEAAVLYASGATIRRGFVDNLVNATAIEYESDLQDPAKAKTGYRQIAYYCAALLNKGFQQDQIIGVLSDTVRWRAYRIASATKSGESFGPDDLILEGIGGADCSAADELAASSLLFFLQTYLGRLNNRFLTASNIAADLGFDSDFSQENLRSIKGAVLQGLDNQPETASLVEDLWMRFVEFVEISEVSGETWKDAYIDEIYLLTLAKLIAANVIARTALHSNAVQAREILQGGFFQAKGLVNLVEFDYFGWILKSDCFEDVVKVALLMQQDLRAYDFTKTIEEDLFGQLMSQLTRRSRRLLLGQAWTPTWLAKLMVRRAIEGISGPIRMLDVCCGTGSFLVEGVRAVMEQLSTQDPPLQQDARVNALVESVTGFDIDPLATILARINWVIAARSWLEPLGSAVITVPVYQADSLFLVTPFLSEESSVALYDQKIDIPKFLITPGFKSVFDRVVDTAYRIAVQYDAAEVITGQTLQTATETCFDGFSVSDDQKQSVSEFLCALTHGIHELARRGKNGVWAFILRNSFRPSLLQNHFNVLATNPPWLTLSRIRDNPYTQLLKARADQLSISPRGAAFLHVEMSTIFLLYAVDRYLVPDASVACVVPDSVLTGMNHEPFRQGGYAKSASPIDFEIQEIWKLDESVFMNKGAVVLGRKRKPPSEAPTTYAGKSLSPEHSSDISIAVTSNGLRSAWTDESVGAKGLTLDCGVAFRQGADIMPRRAFFFELSAIDGMRGRFQISSIDEHTSAIAFAVKDAKKLQSFQIAPTVIPELFVFDVLISHLLTPFRLNSPLAGLLPIRRAANLGTWVPLSGAEIAAYGPTVGDLFGRFKQLWKNLSGELSTKEGSSSSSNYHKKSSWYASAPAAKMCAPPSLRPMSSTSRNSSSTRL